MTYSKTLTDNASRFGLDERTYLFSQLVAAGAQPGDAHAALFTHRGKPTQEQAHTAGMQIINSNPAVALLIRKLKHKRPTPEPQQDNQQEQNNNETTSAENYKDRAKLLEKIIKSTDNLTGKDELQGLLAIAKLQGFDKGEGEQEEQRRYFLPWVSSCRTCRLMEAYKQALNEQKGG